MAVLRAFCIVVAIAGFFLIGTPLQWLVARFAPAAAHRIPLVFCRSLLALLKVRTTTEGLPAEGSAVIMAANHVSWIDILVLGGVRPFCFLAKGEVARWPILSAFAEVQGTVFVDRQRRRSIPPANRRLAERMLEGRTALLFPEGTTVDAAEPATFRSSHFAAARDLLRLSPAHREVTVQPVAISYASPAAAWVGDDDLLSHLWRTLRGAPLECWITFMPPIAYKQASNRKEVARQARDAVIEALERTRRARVTSPPGRPAADLGQVQPSGC